MPKTAKCNTDTTSLMGEVWKDVAGFEGLYQVSNFGRVKSVGREVCHNDVTRKDGTIRDEVWKMTSKILNPIYFGKYAYVHLHDREHNRKNLSVKKLVAQAFLPEYKETMSSINIKYRNITAKYLNSADNLYIEDI